MRAWFGRVAGNAAGAVASSVGGTIVIAGIVGMLVGSALLLVAGWLVVALVLRLLTGG